eukprot:12137446-Alexandrium_andersonii.AAC.1
MQCLPHRRGYNALARCAPFRAFPSAVPRAGCWVPGCRMLRVACYALRRRRGAGNMPVALEYQDILILPGE